MTSKKGFGTFGGVFVPNILTILGVIMYLRMGWVVGNAGLKGTLIILLIANLITLFTAFSISAIATNMRMKGGGAYYLISRSLGAEVGGSVGIPLYLAQALVISLYIVGFTESLSLLFPHLNGVLVSIATLTGLTVIALIRAGLVIKLQFIILCIILLSLVSFFLGGTISFEHIHLEHRYEEGYNFWKVFAVFFPAVTGILSGVSLSGDLKDPSRSVPLGTIWSVITGAIVYFLIAVWFSLTGNPETMVNENLVMVTMAKWGPLIYAGIWGATLSSALANILAGPRTLQALAVDGIVFRIFSRGRGEKNEPMIATLFTYILVGGVLVVGKLNTIAPVLTIFFLITYGSINSIAFLEGLIKRPGFRPAFRVHWAISLVGAAGCIWVMFLINPLACIVGFAFVIFIYLVLKRIQIQKNWGDFRRGIWNALIQFSLLNLERSKDNSISWRPSLLLISRNLITKQKLIQVAFGLTRKSGFLACINIYEAGEYDVGQLENDATTFRMMLEEKRITAFYRNAIVENYLSGQLLASQLHGIGEFRHNTMLLDWSEAIGGGFVSGSSESVDQFRLIRFYSELKISLLLLNINPEIQRIGYRTIDVWWDPSQKNGSFMLVLGHLLASSKYWGEPRLHIKTVVLKEKLEQTRALLQELVIQSRIQAEITVLHPDSDQEVRLGMEFERVQKMRRRRSRWLAPFHRMFNSQDADSERPEIPGGEKSEKEKVQNEINPVDSGDEVLKEKLSDQIQEKDDFIINQHINDIIAENSKHADLVMLGFNLPPRGKEKKYIEKMETFLNKLPDTLLVNCPFDFELFN